MANLSAVLPLAAANGARPTPADPADASRWALTRAYRRLIAGDWHADLEGRIRQQISHVRRDARGTLDTSRNLFRAVWDALAVSYVRTPAVHGEGTADLAAAVDAAGYWALMAGAGERDLYALRDLLVRVDVTPTGELTHRLVYPDCIVATPDPRVPHRAIAIAECVQRVDPRTGKPVWVWDVVDVIDPERPVMQVRSADYRDDLTEAHLGATFEGDAYPYRRADGTPVLPYAFGHARRRSCLWGPGENRELYVGTLEVGCKYTFLGHIQRSASWPQRYAVGAAPAGAAYADDDGDGKGRKVVDADPANVIVMESLEGFEGQPVIGQWQNAADPVAHIEAIGRYERGLIATAPGVSSADIQRMSGDPRSGYAISLSREAQREQQRQQEPQLRELDTAVLELSAVLLNRATGSNHPESGYRVEYRAIPPSAEEKKTQREHLTGMLDLGLVDVVAAYQELHPGTSRADAEAALLRIRAANASFR